jgi:hypothetical protein
VQALAVLQPQMADSSDMPPLPATVAVLTAFVSPENASDSNPLQQLGKNQLH